MTKTEIQDKIKRIVARQLELTVDKIQLQNTAESLGADSLDKAEIMLDVEDEFGIEFPDSVLDQIKTVEELVQFVGERLMSEQNLF